MKRERIIWSVLGIVALFVAGQVAFGGGYPSDTQAILASGVKDTTAKTGGGLQVAGHDGTNSYVLKTNSTGSLSVTPLSEGATGSAVPARALYGGYNDGTNLQGARVYDTHSGAGAEYTAGTVLRSSGAAGSVELGTVANPLNSLDAATSATGAVPPAKAQYCGFFDGTNLQGAQVIDLDGTATAEYALKSNLRFINGAGASTEAGTASYPLRIDPTNTTNQDVNVHNGAGTAAITSATVGAQVGLSTVDERGTLTIGATAAAIPAYVQGAGFSDGANSQIGRVIDLDGTGTAEYGIEVNLRSVNAAGGSLEFGTATNPIRSQDLASSATAAAVPAKALYCGLSDGTNLQGPRVYDSDSGAGTEYTTGVMLRSSGGAGSAEVGTLANPLRTQAVAGGGSQDVNLQDGAGNDITSTVYGATRHLDTVDSATAATAAAIPTVANMSGYSDGTNLQAARVFDIDTNVATKNYALEVNLMSRGDPPAEIGVTANPLKIDPTGTTAQPVTDNAGSLTVDQATATNLKVQIFGDDITSAINTDATGDLQVDIATFPDNEPFNMSQYGGVAVGAANAIHVQPGTGAVFPISDNAGNISIDWAGTVPPIGAGLEATALRVTVATDSTGVLSVDDNGSTLSIDDGAGSITVDGTVAATQSGVWNIGTVTTLTGITNVVQVGDNATTLSIDDGAGSITIDQATATNLKTQIFGDDITSAINTDATGDLQVDLASVPSVKLQDGSGNAITSTLSGAIRGIDTHEVTSQAVVSPAAAACPVACTAMAAQAFTRGGLFRASSLNTQDILVGTAAACNFRLAPGEGVKLTVANANVVYCKYAAAGTVNIEIIGE